MSIIGSAISGLRASSAGLNLQAGNVANQLSDGYKAKRLELSAQSSGGVGVAGVVEDPSPTDPGASNVDLTTETVQGMGYEVMYKANLKVLKTADELMKTTLDMKA